MYSKKVKYEPPLPTQKCKLVEFNNGKNIDIETKRNENPNSSICRFRKISKNEMLDTKTGSVISCKKKENKDINIVVKAFKAVYRCILENYCGTNSELLIKLHYNQEPVNIGRDWKYAFSKLERRCKNKLLFVSVLQYDESNLPRLEIWLKSADNSELILTKELIEECWSFGEIELLEINSNNIDMLARYFIQHNHSKLTQFKPNDRLYNMSRKGLVRPKYEIMDYAEAEKRVVNCEKTFAKTKALVEKAGQKEIILDKITYESYELKTDTSTSK